MSKVSVSLSEIQKIVNEDDLIKFKVYIKKGLFSEQDIRNLNYPDSKNKCKKFADRQLELFGKIKFERKIDLDKIKKEFIAFELMDNNSGGTPLYWAIFYGNVELVKWLIDVGANINAKNNNAIGGTILSWALRHTPYDKSQPKFKEYNTILALLLDNPALCINEVFKCLLIAKKSKKDQETIDLLFKTLINNYKYLNIPNLYNDLVSNNIATNEDIDKLLEEVSSAHTVANYQGSPGNLENDSLTRTRSRSRANSTASSVATITPADGSYRSRADSAGKSPSQLPSKSK